MEQLGFRYPMLPAHIRPLRSDIVLTGRAMPVQDELPVEYGEPSRFDAKPFGLLFESIEALHCCGTRRCATSGFRGSEPI